MRPCDQHFINTKYLVDTSFVERLTFVQTLFHLCLISTMGFPILVRPHLYTESGPCCLQQRNQSNTVLHWAFFFHCLQDEICIWKCPSRRYIFSFKIQIQWKWHCVIIQFLTIKSQQIFSHAMTATLQQNFETNASLLVGYIIFYFNLT